MKRDARHRNMSGIFFYSHQKEVLSQQRIRRKIHMKNICLVCFLLIILSACGSKEPGTVSLKGEIKGLGNDTIYIYGTDEMYDRMDTLLVENDKFSKVLSPDTLVAAWLLFSDGSRYPIFMDKGNKIQIKGSAAELNSLEISGNTPNEELSAFQKTLKGLGKPSEKALEEKAGEFINTHHSSLVSIYLLDQYFVQKEKPDYIRIKNFIEHMTGELKDRPYIDELLDRVQEEEKAAIGKNISYFHLPNAKGKLIGRQDFKDQYLLVHFWASWDTMSRDSNAVYRNIYKAEQKNKKFALLGVSLDINKDDWQKAIKTDTLKWEQVCNFSGWNTDIVKQLAIKTLPANVLLSPSGKVEGKNMTEEDIKKKLKDIEEKEKKKEKEKKEAGRNRTRR